MGIYYEYLYYIDLFSRPSASLGLAVIDGWRQSALSKMRSALNFTFGSPYLGLSSAQGRAVVF